jgi:hypothetical protein
MSGLLRSDVAHINPANSQDRGQTQDRQYGGAYNQIDAALRMVLHAHFPQIFRMRLSATAV